MSKYRFNFKDPKTSGKAIWFIGEGQYDQASGLFTGDLALDFAHYWGQEYINHIPANRKNCGMDAMCAWVNAYNGDYDIYIDGKLVGVSALSIVNVMQFDCDPRPQTLEVPPTETPNPQPPTEREARHIDKGLQMNKYSFNFKDPKFSKEIWFIGEGSYDQATGHFTGDLTLDFAHHWGQAYKDHKPANRKECGTDDAHAWTYGFNGGSGHHYGYVVGAAALPITNVTQLDCDPVPDLRPQPLDFPQSNTSQKKQDQRLIAALEQALAIACMEREDLLFAAIEYIAASESIQTPSDDVANMLRFGTAEQRMRAAIANASN